LSEKAQDAAPFGPIDEVTLRWYDVMYGQASSTMSQAIHIVVIDDNPGSLELLSMALARPEVAVHTASTPAEGLALVRKLHPQLVVTDLVMPKMNGLEVLQEIFEFDPMIDVLLMTAHYTSETAVEAIKMGASDYLNKPISIAALRSKVEKPMIALSGVRNS